MRSLILFSCSICAFFSTWPLLAQTTAKVDLTEQAAPIITVELSEAQKKELEEKAKGLVMDLWDYMNIIADRSQSRDNRVKAVELAISLFNDESHIVQVTGRSGIISPKIRPYFERLRLLPYDQVELTGADFAIISNVRRDVDGKFYTTVVTQQQFRAYKDGKLVIDDLDFKRTQIIIESVPRADGRGLEFIVKLGDIKVDIGESSLVRY